MSTEEVIVGYLATHQDGYAARLGPDLARAEIYATHNHATLEPMYVKRARPDQWPKPPESKPL